jgi:two-component system, chemotaxis family, sensor kinase CheA
MDLSKYLGLFVAEAREHLAAAYRIAAEPEHPLARADSVRDLLRHAHSLKGMAASMGYRAMATLAHRLEDLLDAHRGGTSVPPDEHAALVLDALGSLERMVALAEQQAPVEDADAPGIASRLAEASAPGAGGPPGERSPSPDAPATRNLRISVVLSPAAASPPVQAAMILGRLGGLGRVVQSDPPPAALRMGRLDGRLVVLLETERPAADVENELRYDAAVASFGVEPLAPEDAPRDRPVSPASWIRVRADVLDAVLERVLDLMFEQGRLSAPLRDSRDREAAAQMERCRALLRAIHADVMEMRLIAFDSVAHRLSRAVHDLARRLGKPVRFDIAGRDVRMDRSMLEALVDPLLHMVRNAVDHGIEDPEARRASGKDEAGAISLSVERRADRILITLEDDGRGLDPRALRLAAVERGILGPSEAARLGEAECLMLATLPGFSTAAAVTDVSGRGVGLDAARAGIESLGGRLEIRSAPGRGASMRILLPMTLAMIQTILVRSRGHLFAIPASAVERMLPSGEAVVSSDGTAQAPVRLDERLGIETGEPCAGRASPVLVCPVGERRKSLQVDEVLGQRNVLVKPLLRPVSLLPEYSGAALLEDGSVVLVLDPAALLG